MLLLTFTSFRNRPPEIGLYGRREKVVPTSPESVARAEELLQQHGARTLQVLIDHIVAAVRAGSEEDIRDLDRLMRAVELRLANRQ